MIKCYVFRVFALLVLAASTMLAGCASSVTRVDTWEGASPQASEAAVIKAPGEIQVSRINGRSMTRFLMDDLALDYGVLPGSNELIFTYKTIWAKTGVVQNGESKVYVIESEPQVIRFNARAGAVYRFRFNKPSSRREAEAMLPEFSADLVTEAGERVASSGKWRESVSPASARTPIGHTETDTGAELSASTLEQLQTLWDQATEEEKRTFLRWAFE